MDLRSLRIFVTIADCGTVSHAARLLYTTQPSLSRQVQRFEAQLGTRLFDRDGHRMSLSAAGRRLLPVARELVSRTDLAGQTVAALRIGAPGAVMLSAPRTTVGDVIAPFLAEWGPEDPLPMVSEARSRDVYATLEEGADLAVGAAIPPRRLHHLVIADLPLWAYVPLQHRWSGRSSVELAELEQEQLLVLSPEEHSRIALDQALLAESLPQGPMVEFGTAEIAQAVAATGRGIAVVTDDSRYDLVGLPILALNGELSIRLHAAWSREHYAEAVLADLARRLRDFTRRRYELATD